MIYLFIEKQKFCQKFQIQYVAPRENDPEIKSAIRASFFSTSSRRWIIHPQNSCIFHQFCLTFDSSNPRYCDLSFVDSQICVCSRLIYIFLSIIEIYFQIAIFLWRDVQLQQVALQDRNRKK